MILPRRAAAVDRLRTDAEFRNSQIPTALVARMMGDVMTYQIAVDGWLFWIYVNPDGAQTVIC